MGESAVFRELNFSGPSMGRPVIAVALSVAAILAVACVISLDEGTSMREDAQGEWFSGNVEAIGMKVNNAIHKVRRNARMNLLETSDAPAPAAPAAPAAPEAAAPVAAPVVAAPVAAAPAAGAPDPLADEKAALKRKKKR